MRVVIGLAVLAVFKSLLLLIIFLFASDFESGN